MPNRSIDPRIIIMSAAIARTTVPEIFIFLKYKCLLIRIDI